FKYASDRVTGGFRLINASDHLFFRIRIGATQRREIADIANGFGARDRQDLGNSPELRDVAQDLDIKCPEHFAGDGPGCDTGGGLSSRGSFQDVAEVSGLVLYGPGKIGMSGTGPSEFSRI